MSILYEEMRVPSSDGIHTLAGRVYRPEGRVRGLFHVVHGMTEHIARYDPLFRRMAEDGYLCFGYDHLGHGATARDAGELGYIAGCGGVRRCSGEALCGTVGGGGMPAVLPDGAQHGLLHCPHDGILVP